jgi:hypothetical protein
MKTVEGHAAIEVAEDDPIADLIPQMVALAARFYPSSGDVKRLVEETTARANVELGILAERESLRLSLFKIMRGIVVAGMQTAREHPNDVGDQRSGPATR